jgi:glycosyltransferase involved in cell wall biosynthesis
MRLGFIARVDNGGLGVLSKAIVKHLEPTKIMSVLCGLKSFPGRYPQAMVVKSSPTDKECEKFLDGLDVLLAFETPYNWNIFNIAKKRGVKTVLFIDYEWLPDPIPVMPDLILNPSNWNMEKLPLMAKFFPFPIDRDVHKFKERKVAKTFLHIVGHGGSHGRNGTEEFLKAIPLVKGDVKFIIHSQVPVSGIEDKRIEWRIGNYTEESYMFRDSDVLVSPRRFAGLSLPLNEAMSQGLAILMSDMDPQNKFLHPDLLLPVKRSGLIRIMRDIDYGVVSPEDIARKIDIIAGKDITKYSQHSNRYAESISWKKLKGELLKVLDPSY